jgi:hypothetical protein
LFLIHACSIAISSWPYLQDAIYSSPPLQLSRKVVRTRSEHSSQSAHTLHYVRNHPGTIAEWNLISANIAEIADRIESKQKRLKSSWSCICSFVNDIVMSSLKWTTYHRNLL